MIDHPLFPAADDDPEPPDVERIHVTRFEKTGQAWCPRIFSAEELPGLDAVYEMFGGGSYELIGRSSKNPRGQNLISARRRYVIPGPSKSLVDDEATSEPSSPSPSMMSVPGGGGLWAALLAMAPTLVQAWMASQKEHTAMLMTMMQQNSQMLLAMVQGQKADSQTFIQAMAKLNESEKATMAQFFGELAKTKAGGGGNDLEALMAGLELGQTLSGKGDDDGGGADIGSFAQIATALAELSKAQASQAQAAAPPASQPSPPLPHPPAQG